MKGLKGSGGRDGSGSAKGALCRCAVLSRYVRVSVGPGLLSHSAHPVWIRGMARTAWLVPHTAPSRTQTAAALAVRLQDPALIAGALHTELVLVTFLAAFEVLGTVALDLAGVVVRAQLHAQWARAHDPFTRSHRAVVTTATVIQRALVCGDKQGTVQGQDLAGGRTWLCPIPSPGALTHGPPEASALGEHVEHENLTPGTITPFPPHLPPLSMFP